VSSLLLLLLDSRSPAGGHNHSGGMEPAIGSGMVRDLADVEEYCRGRLRTSGRVAAAFAAVAFSLWPGEPAGWAELDAEFDARAPSEAVRAASRQLGSGLRRLLRATVPQADLTTPWAALPSPAPHHPLVLGAGVALAGGTPELAARAAALGAVSVPASAVRLLGLDPFAVHALLARLAPSIDECAATSGLPADSAPALDLLADFHLTTEVRLFAS